jgi:transmembrane sensor
MTSISMDDRIQAEARRWFARLLAPDCASAERVAFERWRGADPDHAAAYDRVEWLMGRVAELRDDPAIDHAARNAVRARPARRSWPRVAGFALAAGIVLAVVGIVILRASHQMPPAVRYATAVGEQRSIQLADGSTIRLDTDTQIDVRYTSDERQVDLLHGRAQYTVAHDTARPFVVATLGGTVTAVGTEFQTGIRDGTVVVTLLRGKVIVADDASANPPHRTVLVPGEQLVYNASGTLWNKTSADVEAASDWTQGKLVFKGEPLRDLVREVNRYSSAKLRIADPSITNLRISGTFKADDQESLLLALQGIWSIHATPQPDGEILLTRKH